MIIPNAQHKNNSTRTRANTEMDILESPKEWINDFQKGWVAHLTNTGKIDWGKYTRHRNRFAPSGPGIKLSDSRLMLISSAGAYLHASQNPFDASNKFGDYSIRMFAANSLFEDISFSHEHYDMQYVNADPQVLLPLRHLEAFLAEGYIGELASNVISFSGYHPNVLRVVKELIPKILVAAKEDKVNAVILVPS